MASHAGRQLTTNTKGIPAMNSDTFDGLVAGLLLGIGLTVAAMYAIAWAISADRRRPSRNARRVQR